MNALTIIEPLSPRALTHRHGRGHDGVCSGGEGAAAVASLLSGGFVVRLVLVLALAATLLSPTAEARGGHSSSYCASCARDSRGHIARSPEAWHEFMRETGYPHGRPGYVVDHIVPLKRGGADAPSNMQWQTKADAKAKDRVE